MIKIYNWVHKYFMRLILTISLALVRVETEILKADPNDLDERGKKNQRMRHRNPILEKFYIGETDEKFVHDYYEILKGADKFMRNATPHKMAVASDKYGMSYGKADIHGRVHEHYGFFDEKNKNFGKTIAEVAAIEKMSRRTTDDDYELENIYSNIPIEVGFVKVIDNLGDDKQFEYKLNNLVKSSEHFEFPMKVSRVDDRKPINRIEHITEYLHVKKIGMDVVRLEFFIPNKFKTSDLDLDSKIMIELIDVDQIFFKEKYGNTIGFKVDEFIEKKTFGEYEVFKFNGVRMENIN